MPSVPIDDEDHLRLVLDYLGEELEPSILIGGWATFARVGGDISHDIDLIIGSPEVREKVRTALSELSESSHLQCTQWRGNFEGVHVDVYIPHQSELGAKLRLRVEVLALHTDPLDHGGWRLLTIEAHTLSKLAALLYRPDSEKGFKDAREDLPDHVMTAFTLLGPRSGANKAQREQLRRWQREWTAGIQAAIDNTQRGRPTLT